MASSHLNEHVVEAYVQKLLRGLIHRSSVTPPSLCFNSLPYNKGSEAVSKITTGCRSNDL